MGENKYQNGKIYKIVDIGYNKCYIGSTCESLSQRMARHRQKYKSYLKGASKLTHSFLLFDEYGEENCKVEWIEDYPCSSKRELEAREGYHQQNTDCVNKVIAGRDKKEYLALHTWHFALDTSHLTLHTLTIITLHFTLDTMRFHTLHSTLRTPHFTLSTPHSKFPLYTSHSTPLHCTLHAPRTTIYTSHLTPHTLHATLHTCPSI